MSGVNPQPLRSDDVTAPNLFYKCPLLSLTEWIGGIILFIHVIHLPLTVTSGWVVDLKLKRLMVKMAASWSAHHVKCDTFLACLQLFLDHKRGKPRICLFCLQMSEPESRQN